VIRRPFGAAAAALLVIALALPATAAEPDCLVRCRDMARKGELKKGVNEKGCVTRVCQEDGRRLYASGKYEEALVSLDVLAPDLEQSPSFHADRGNVNYALGRFDAALADYDASLALYPDAFRTKAQRGHTLMRLRKFSEARAQFDELLADKGAEREYRGLRTKSYLLGNLGVCDVLGGDTAKGRAELKEALDIDGRNAQAALFVYRVFPALDAGTIDATGLFSLLAGSEDVGLGLRPRAEPEVAKVIASHPKFPESYFLMAEILRSEHRYEECEKLMLGGVRAIPGDVDLKAERLRCTLLKLGPTSAAAKPSLKELKQLSEANPENAQLKEILHALDLY
jgi:tetratricopeptide (TPR) repeat protein